MEFQFPLYTYAAREDVEVGRAKPQLGKWGTVADAMKTKGRVGATLADDPVMATEQVWAPLVVDGAVPVCDTPATAERLAELDAWVAKYGELQLAQFETPADLARVLDQVQAPEARIYSMVEQADGEPLLGTALIPRAQLG